MMLPKVRVEAVASRVLASEPFACNPVDSRAQSIISPSATEAVTVSVSKLVDAAFRLDAAAKGSTVSLIEGDMVGRALFAVSIYPERSVELIASPTWQNIFAFASLNLDLLVKPGHAFGSWRNRGHIHVLDVVLCIPDRRTAIELGRMFGQTSIYDLANQREIAIRARRIPGAQLHLSSKRSFREQPLHLQAEALLR